MTFFRPWFAIVLLFVLLACAGGCARPKAVPQPQPEAAKPQAVGKHILLVVPQSNFSDQYFEKLHEILNAEGAAVRLAAPRATTVSSINGLILPTDVSLELADAAQFDALIFIGGKGASSLFQNEDALRLAREAVEHDKVLGASGAATLILGLAGVLEGKKATSPPRLARSFADVAQCTYDENPVVTDGNIVTTGSPDAGESFARAIVNLLQ